MINHNSLPKDDTNISMTAHHTYHQDDHHKENNVMKHPPFTKYHPGAWYPSMKQTPKSDNIR